MRTIPIVDVSPKIGLDSLLIFKDETREFIDTTTRYVPKAAIRVLDSISRRFLERSEQPHLNEIVEIAAALGRPGGYFFNACYEWGCTIKAQSGNRGPELVRVLDWPFHEMGKTVKMLRVAGKAGLWYTPTWPGYAGIVHGFAPGRFAAAINQAPLQRSTGSFYLDWVIDRQRVWRASGMLPALLLRSVMHEAPDYATALRMLCETPICHHAIFSIVGLNEDEYAIVERTRDQAFVAKKRSAANHFTMTTDGHHRGSVSPRREEMLSAIDCDSCEGAIPWLRKPVLNEDTVLAFIANPSTGVMQVVGIKEFCSVTPTLIIEP